MPVASFGGRKVRALLRILVTRRGCYLPHDVLAERLWPDRLPADPAANLQVLVNRARRAVGRPDLILTGPGGYALTTEPWLEVDVDQYLGRPSPVRGAHRSDGRPGLSSHARRRGRRTPRRGPVRVLGRAVRGRGPPRAPVRLGAGGGPGPGVWTTGSGGRVGPGSASGRTAPGSRCAGAGPRTGRSRRSGCGADDPDGLPPPTGRGARGGSLTGGGGSRAAAAALRGGAHAGVAGAQQLRGAALRGPRSRADEHPAPAPAGSRHDGGRDRRPVWYREIQTARRGRPHRPGHHRPGVLGRPGRGLGAGTSAARRGRGGRLHGRGCVARPAADRLGHRAAGSRLPMPWPWTQ